MCGNLGILLLFNPKSGKVTVKVVNSETGELEQSDPATILKPAEILREMVAATAIRGAQAGGFSALAHPLTEIVEPRPARIRTIGRKRCDLADDLTNLFIKQVPTGHVSDTSGVSVIGHTRFATGSLNTMPELHPHDWSASGYDADKLLGHHDRERIWWWDGQNHQMVEKLTTFAVHLTHNGDFEAFDCYSRVMVVDDVGIWLNKVLPDTPNQTKGDSPKVAGLVELMRVQGRWGPALRLAWLRVACKSANDVVKDGYKLEGDAPSIVPGADVWARKWASGFNREWKRHAPAMIRPVDDGRYEVDHAATVEFKEALCQMLAPLDVRRRLGLGAELWTPKVIKGFVHHAVRGFLFADLYEAVGEVVHRAHGSLGLQVHCTIERQVVIIASQEQPMSVSFTIGQPLVLFGSEATAVQVPVMQSGASLNSRIDLDVAGTLVRIGPMPLLAKRQYTKHGHARGTEPPKLFATGTFGDSRDQLPNGTGQVPLRTMTFTQDLSSSSTDDVPMARRNRWHPDRESSRHFGDAPGKANDDSLDLGNGISLRMYSLVEFREFTSDELEQMYSSITEVTANADPRKDLVRQDLIEIPATIAAIDDDWSQSSSINALTADALAARLLNAMRQRRLQQLQTIDLLIGGVETSLWLAEQFAVDVARLCPWLTVRCVSANKLMGVLSMTSNRVHFSGEERVSAEQVADAAVLLVSHSGQTFPALRATEYLERLVENRIWLLTGTPQSQMELALNENERDRRVFISGAGYRPAEPSSLAVAAMHHTFTRLLVHIAAYVRVHAPNDRLRMPWEIKLARSSIAAQRHQQTAARAAAAAIALATAPENEVTSLTPGAQMSHPPISARSHHLQMPGRLKREPTISEQRLIDAAHAHSHDMLDKPLLNLTDACLVDLRNMLRTSIVPNLKDIVGIKPEASALPNKSRSALAMPNKNKTRGLNHKAGGFWGWLAPNAEKQGALSVHEALRKQGKRWGRHVSEPWLVLIFVAFYVFVSVTFSVPICQIIIQVILRVAGQAEFVRAMDWSVFEPIAEGMLWLPLAVGFVVRFCDAAFYIYCGKLFTYALRLADGRPLWARHGHRTITIVETRTNHRLLEQFTSKLFAQSYSFNSITVHSAEGVDDFVHNFTHRVARGSLIAMGRPDGRMCCLAKTESATLLAGKQAFFVQNADYPQYLDSGNGPEVVSIGHNTFCPPAFSAHIVLPSFRRKLFVDEVCYERVALSLGQVMPESILRLIAHKFSQDSLSAPMLKALAVDKPVSPRSPAKPRTLNLAKPAMKGSSGNRLVPPGVTSEVSPPTLEREGSAATLLTRSVSTRSDALMRSYSGRSERLSRANSNRSDASKDSRHQVVQRAVSRAANYQDSPYGAHFIKPFEDEKGSFQTPASLLRQRALQQRAGDEPLSEIPDDPNVKIGFLSKLDPEVQNVHDREVRLQHFYESRIAALERYVAFCVMFHAMAEANHKPPFRKAWNVGRSQSNLRVATTAAPVPGSDALAAVRDLNAAAAATVRLAGSSMRGFTVHF